MTYAADLAKNHHGVGYYLTFDGIPTVFSTHANSSLSTEHVSILEVSGGDESLDRTQGVVIPAGFSLRIADDSTVRNIFRRRGGTETTIKTATAKASTSVQIQTNTYADGTTVYIGKETVTLGTHIASGLYTGCTRAVSGSVAQRHPAGIVVSSVPRYWLGRRGVLTVFNLDTESETDVVAGVLTSSPRYSNGVWELEFTGLNTELNRPIMYGWEPVRPTSVPTKTTVTVGGNTYGCFQVEIGDDGANFLSDGGFSSAAQTLGAHVAVTDGQQMDVYAIDNGAITAGTPDTIKLRFDRVVYSTDIDGPVNQLLGLHATANSTDFEIRQVCYLKGTPGSIFAALLLSDEGDGNNHATYDYLPAVTPATSSTFTTKRVGAALPSTWVDDTTFNPRGNNQRHMSLLLDEPTTLIDLWRNEFFFRMGGYLYVTPSGKISFKEILPAVPSSSISTLTESDIALASVGVIDDETDIVSTAKWASNYSYLDNSYRLTTEVRFGDVSQLYGDQRAPYEFESKSLWIGAGEPPWPQAGGPAYGHTDLVTALDRIYSRVKNGLRKVTMLLPWRQHTTATIGTEVKVTDTRMPDLEGGIGVSARTHDVVSRTVDFKSGTVEVRLEEMQSGKLIAPSFVVGSYDAGDISIDITGAEADLFPSANEPAYFFPLGSTLRIFDASASPPFSASDTWTIDAIMDETTISVSGGSAFTPAAGDLGVLEYSADTGNTSTNSAADVSDHAFMQSSSSNSDTEWL